MPRQPFWNVAVSMLMAFLKRWGPVVLMMALIFLVSSGAGSFQRSSRIIGPLLTWLFPAISAETVHACIVAVRKGAHLTEYALLALLAWRALRQRESGPGWRWSTARAAVLIVFAYACTDELHQVFVPQRQGSLLDVGIDTFGGVAGILALWGFGRLLKRW